MIFQILNGDSMAFQFPLADVGGEMIIDRECLLVGELYGSDLPAFWKTRAGYLKIPYSEYYQKVVTEFEKLWAAPNDSEFNLWFEFDLFCQVNLWFVIAMLAELPIKKTIYLVYSSFLARKDPDFWNGFGAATPEQLKQAYMHRILLKDVDIQMGSDLWYAYKNRDLLALQSLSEIDTSAFVVLKEVIQAHLARFPNNGESGRPEKIIEEIIRTTSSDFPSVCREFWKTERIYGFGDTQVKELYDKIMQTISKD